MTNQARIDRAKELLDQLIDKTSEARFDEGDFLNQDDVVDLNALAERARGLLDPPEGSSWKTA